MTSVGQDVGPVQHLRDAIEPVQPEHDDLKILRHEGEGAYTVVAVPDYLAELFLCDKESSQHPYDVTADPNNDLWQLLRHTLQHAYPWRAFCCLDPALGQGGPKVEDHCI